MQNTLAHSFSLSGIGIHTGTHSTLRVHPASENFGRIFRLGQTEIPALADWVVDTARCTTLGRGGVTLSTVEHLLSALAGLEIDNVLIEVEGRELPILDGSALPFAEAVLEAGIAPQKAPAKRIGVKNSAAEGEGGSFLKAESGDTLTLTSRTEFDFWPQGWAEMTLTLSPDVYLGEIAPARTFAFRHEVDALLKAGLAKGGSLDNALIITPPDEFSTPLRLSQEWCRHKLLDLIGDLALLNARPHLVVTAVRPGHRLNVALAQTILQENA